MTKPRDKDLTVDQKELHRMMRMIRPSTGKRPSKNESESKKSLKEHMREKHMKRKGVPKEIRDKFKTKRV